MSHHQDYAKPMNEAIAGYRRSLGRQCGRLHWLQSLKARFVDHRTGPAFYAYSLVNAQL